MDRQKRLGTSQRQEEKMGAILRPAARKHPPNAGPVVYPREFSCCAAPLRAWDGYPGKPFHRPPGQTCLESADWDTVDPGSRAGAVLWVSGCGRLST